MLSLLNTTFTNTLRQGFTLIGSLLSKLKARSTFFENKAGTKVILQEIDTAGLLEKASIITTPTAYSDGVLHSVKPSESPYADFTFTRNNIGTRVNSSGNIESVGVDLPRIDYTDGVGSILLEPQSQNLITYSEDFTQSDWSHNATLTITPNYATSPDGTLNATRLNRVASGNRLAQDINLESGKTYTLSFYMKNNGGTSTLKTRFNPHTTDQPYTITNDWARYEFTFTATSDVETDVRLISGAVDIDLYIWGVQFEESSYATSYIPTVSSSQTRAVDSATDAGSSDLISSTEGVLYAEIAALVNAGVDRIISISNGSNIQTLRLELDAVSNRVRVALKVSPTTSFNVQFDLTDITQFFKVAVAYNQNDLKLYVNGALRDSATVTVVLPSNTFDRINFNRGDGPFQFEGKVKCVAVFKEALTDQELTDLTTI